MPRELHALGHAALGLAFHCIGVEPRPAIVGEAIALNFHHPRLGIDLDLHDVDCMSGGEVALRPALFIGRGPARGRPNVGGFWPGVDILFSGVIRPKNGTEAPKGLF